MGLQNRKTLKNYFKEGSMPSETHFDDLIDSMHNIVDEGLNKSFKNGLELAEVGNYHQLISFFKNILDKDALWHIAFEEGTNDLKIQAVNKDYSFHLSEKGNFGINTNKPQHTLDVNGVIASKGRTGTYKTGLVPADGKWHNILTDLRGCHAFEIMAGAKGKSKSGHISLIKADALCVYGKQKKVKYLQSFYRSRCTAIKVRWRGKQDNYSLQIKTACNYGDDYGIKYNITNLWMDPMMECCQLTEDI